MITSSSPDLENMVISCPLDQLGLIRITGEDAQAFLQGQLTNDIRLITQEISQIAGYCTAKGRLLATLLLWKTEDGYCAQLHGGIAPAVQKRLSMFVLRAKVQISDASPVFSRLGFGGQGATALLSAVCGKLPDHAMQTVNGDGLTIIRLHGATPRFEIIAAPEIMAGVRAQLENECVAADFTVWEWLEIRAGIPQVGPATQEDFIPQMLNLDLLDGISFKKGCYTGQEIVARTHYLGKVKRRTVLAHLGTETIPLPGSALYGLDSTEPVGKVVNAAAAPAGGCDLLAEVRLESMEAGGLRLHGPDGPTLSLLSMPYAL